jgi:flavin-dependent dehydrogenase
MSERENDTLQQEMEHYDVAILGGGLAGLTLALQLKQTRPTCKILVVEKQPHPVPEAAHKVGESTVEIAAHYLRDILGLGEHLQTRQLPKFGLRFFFSTDDNQDITRRVELGHAALPPVPVETYQLDRGRLENALGEEVRAQGVLLLDGAKVQQVTLQPECAAHSLRVLHMGSEQEFQARWIVDASGRSSLLKRQLGLAKKVDHHVNAVWFRVGYPIDINEWSNNEDWHARIREGERSLSTNHLMGPGYWVWLIPLASGSISIGIVADADMHPFEEMNRFERAMEWLYQHEPQCAQAVEQHLDKIQDFRVMKDYSYSCEQTYSSDRWCLTGEAGFFLDPFYSPGSDMIAISNGLVGDLVTRDLDGEDIEDLAAIHTRLMLMLNDSWRGTYEHQYPIMGNAQVMIAKIIWDTTVYWAAPGLLYFHDAFLSFGENFSIAMSMLRFSILSEHVQKFFREWCAINHEVATDVFVRYYDFDFMAKLHIGMTADLSATELQNRFSANVHFLEQLAGQLVSTVIESYAGPTENEVVRDQVQRWQDDQFLTDLQATYQQDTLEQPVSSGWITLGRQTQEISR